MCINCLDSLLSSLKEYEEDITEIERVIPCQGCKKWYGECLEINKGMKVLCLTKKKLTTSNCIHSIKKYEQMEQMTYFKIKSDLNRMLENLDNSTDIMKEHSYIDKCNQLKCLNEFLQDIEEVDLWEVV